MNDEETRRNSPRKCVCGCGLAETRLLSSPGPDLDVRGAEKSMRKEKVAEKETFSGLSSFDREAMMVSSTFNSRGESLVMFARARGGAKSPGVQQERKVK
jgi:hypothetical protein